MFNWPVRPPQHAQPLPSPATDDNGPLWRPIRFAAPYVAGIGANIPKMEYWVGQFCFQRDGISVGRATVNRLNPRPPIAGATDEEMARWVLSECVNTPDGCMLWPHGTSAPGYGKTRVAGGHVACHRLVYRSLVGEIPSGMFVCHACDTPRCCRPEHLFLGTPAENSADMVKKGRGPKNAGERHGNAKLTAEDVRAIRKLRRVDGLKFREIAEAFGITKAYVRSVTEGVTWRHVD